MPFHLGILDGCRIQKLLILVTPCKIILVYAQFQGHERTLLKYYLSWQVLIEACSDGSEPKITI